MEKSWEEQLGHADFSKWTRRDLWSGNEFIFLLAGLEPPDGVFRIWFKIRRITPPPHFQEVNRLLIDAVRIDSLRAIERDDYVADCRFRVSDLIHWAQGKGLDVPTPLLAVLDTELEAKAPHQWGFSHDTELLRIARQVIVDYWECKDPKRAPDKESLVAELQSIHGLSKNEAEAVDLLTRHDSRRNKSRKSVG